MGWVEYPGPRYWQRWATYRFKRQNVIDDPDRCIKTIAAHGRWTFAYSGWISAYFSAIGGAGGAYTDLTMYRPFVRWAGLLPGRLRMRWGYYAIGIVRPPLKMRPILDGNGFKLPPIGQTYWREFQTRVPSDGILRFDERDAGAHKIIGPWNTAEFMGYQAWWGNIQAWL